MCLWLIGALPIAASAQYLPFQLRARINPEKFVFPMVLKSHGGYISVIGELTPATAFAFASVVQQDESIHTIYIDSAGGNIASALDMAALIHKRKLRLVVDGKCLSACANYLFVAAEEKDVLTGSVVGIHQATHHFIGKDGKRASSTALHLTDIEEHKPTGESAAKIRALQIRESKFFEEFGVSRILFNSYVRYVLNREKFMASTIATQTSYPSCPAIGVWLLNKTQLQSMGVKGIKEYWFPHTELEWKDVIINQRFIPNTAFFGDASSIESLCTTQNPLLTAIERNVFDVLMNIKNLLRH
jgi:ATP-dependent protease ClpP protease subunit